MKALLLGEGSSDRALLPALRWLLDLHSPVPATLEWLDSAHLPGRKTLQERVMGAGRVAPCNLLFVHRDADRQGAEHRYDEIRRATGDLPHVGVVPVRMTEAWLLFDEPAIRAAAGRPSGTHEIGLPRLAQLEDLPDPKKTLLDVLAAAHGATGRRAQRFDERAAIHRVADLIEDWTPLRRLSAFARLEADVRAAVQPYR